MVVPAPANLAIQVLEKAQSANPYSADISLALMQYKAAAGDEKGAAAEFYWARTFLPTKYLAPAVLKMFQISAS
jgi:hypothetical protein